jgi:hypothetical protein
LRIDKKTIKTSAKARKNRETIRAAIKARRIIEFYYHGGYRTVEPFALGIVMYGDADNESLLCYQTEGYNDLEKTEGWKLYRASEMEDMRVSEKQFPGDRPEYDPDDIDMSEVIECVRFEKPAVKRSFYLPPRYDSAVPGYLTHNQLMRRFRFSHPMPQEDIYTLLYSDPWRWYRLRRTEWEKRHLAEVLEALQIAETRAEISNANVGPIILPERGTPPGCAVTGELETIAG